MIGWPWAVTVLGLLATGLALRTLGGMLLGLAEQLTERREEDVAEPVEEGIPESPTAEVELGDEITKLPHDRVPMAGGDGRNEVRCIRPVGSARRRPPRCGFFSRYHGARSPRGSDARLKSFALELVAYPERR
jgi:hypothetical protein